MNMVQLESAPAWSWPSLLSLPCSAQPGLVTDAGSGSHHVVPQVPCPLPYPAATSCRGCCRSQLLCGSLQCCQNPWDMCHITACRALIPSENKQLSAQTEKLTPLISPHPSGRVEIPYTYLFPLIHLSRALGGTPSTGVWEAWFPPEWVPGTGPAPSFAQDPGASSRVRSARRAEGTGAGEQLQAQGCGRAGGRSAAGVWPRLIPYPPSSHKPQPCQDRALLHGIPGGSSDGQARGPCSPGTLRSRVGVTA